MRLGRISAALLAWIGLTRSASARAGVLVNIQALRGIAAMLVVCVHMAPLFVMLGLPKFGAEGVSLFFVLSGYIMVETTSGRQVSPASFLKNRVSRIVPLYWAITLAVIALGLVAPHLLTGTNVTLLTTLKSLLFVPYRRLDGSMEPILFVGWTLNYEMAFYALFALSLCLDGVMLRAVAVLAVLVAAVVAGLVLRGGDLWRFYTNQIILQFGAGVVIALFRRDIARWVGGIPAILAGGACLALILALSFNSVLVPASISRSIAGAESAIIVGLALGLEDGGHKMTWPALLLIGDASYSIYLVHPFLTEAVLLGSHHVHLGMPGIVGAVIVAFASVLLVGGMLHASVEVRASRWARRVLGTARLGPDVKSMA
jgi:exopolysaccharide production protein ExoZ